MPDSRFPKQFHIDFCYSPIKISKLGRTYFVPCGKCNGCLLHKANEWSFRVGDEIENNPFSIFFTLTYSNKYVPKVKCVGLEDGLYRYHSTSNDIRFNGAVDVFRTPLDFYLPFIHRAPLFNYFDDGAIGVCRKTDIQLWLKLIRKDLYDYFNLSGSAFRYFIISEYGPGKSQMYGKFRPHYHGIIFPTSEEVAESLLYPTKEIEKFQKHGLLFANWQMCDGSLFEQYAKYCNSGTRHYVTQYVNCSTGLPSFYQYSDIKPFRLASKQKAGIGFVHFDPKEISQDIERGVIEYHKSVPDSERNYIFRYSPSYVSTLFPKCSRYSELDYPGLLRIYGYLYKLRKISRSSLSPSSRFYEDEFRPESQDWSAALACLKVCDLMSWTPVHYVYVLDKYYYLKAQSALKYQYEWQEKHIGDPYLCCLFYSNVLDFIDDCSGIRNFEINSPYHDDVVREFFRSFGLLFDSSIKDKLIEYSSKVFDSYFSEVDDIWINMDKSKKVNSISGLAPHIV